MPVNHNPNPMFIRAECSDCPRTFDERKAAIVEFRNHPDGVVQAIARRYEVETTVDSAAVGPMAASLTAEQIASWRLHGRYQREIVDDEELSATGRAAIRLRTGWPWPPE